MVFAQEERLIVLCASLLPLVLLQGGFAFYIKLWYIIEDSFTLAVQSYSTNQYTWEAYICERPWALRAATHLASRDIDSSASVLGHTKTRLIGGILFF